MVNFTNSPNMTLPIPTVGVDPGPDYALNINAALTLIDQHDHTPGKGVQITPNGLNINQNLNFNDNAAVNLDYLGLTPQLAASSVIQTLSVAPGGDTRQDLFYTDSNGTQIQLTKAGLVNATASSIPGEAYVGGTFIWTQTQSGMPTTPANFDIGSITIRPNIASTTLGTTLLNAGGAMYNLTLPTNPGSLVSPAFVTINSSGQLLQNISTSAGITGSMIAAATITTTNIQQGAQTPLNYESFTGTTNTVTGGFGSVYYDSTAGASTLTLYSASVYFGFTLIIKKTSADFNVITVNTTSGQTIDGAATTTIATQNETLTLISDGSNWKIQDRSYPQTWSAATFGTRADLVSGTQTSYIRREGDSLHCRVTFANITVTTTAGMTNLSNCIVLPSSLSIDTTKALSTFTKFGSFIAFSNSQQFYSGAPQYSAGDISYFSSTPTAIMLSSNASGTVTTAGYTTFSMPSQSPTTNGHSITADFVVPILGWS